MHKHRKTTEVRTQFDIWTQPGKVPFLFIWKKNFTNVFLNIEYSKLLQIFRSLDFCAVTTIIIIYLDEKKNPVGWHGRPQILLWSLCRLGSPDSDTVYWELGVSA